jgi:hypothetical protein
MTNRRRISFDVDGVVCEGGYLTPSERSAERYMKCQLREPQVVECINRLLFDYDVYFISSRDHNNALESTREWLENQGVFMEMVAGTIVGIPPYNKPHLCRMLGISAHFDDCPASCGATFTWLVDNPTWQANQEAKHLYQPQVVSGWDEIMEVIYTKLDQKFQQMLIPFEVATGQVAA